MNSLLRNLFLGIIFLCSMNLLSAQEFHLGVQSGYGYYKMERLKSMDQRVTGRIPIEKKNIVAYPPFYYYQPFLNVDWERISVGIVLSKYTTGSRWSAKDYSGEYRLDSYIYGTTFGAVTKLPLNLNNRFTFSLYNETGWINTRLENDEFLEIDGVEVFSEAYTFRSRNYYSEFGLELKVPVRFIQLYAHAGYLFQYGGKGFKTYHEGEYIEMKDFEGPIKPQWNGARIGGSVAFNLSRILMPGNYAGSYEED